MSDSEGWESASQENIQIDEKKRNKRMAKSESKLFMLHKLLNIFSHFYRPVKYFISSELNEHEKYSDLIKGRNLIAHTITANTMDVHSRSLCSTISHFFSLNINGIHSRIYFVVGKSVSISTEQSAFTDYSAFTEHQFGSKVVPHRNKYPGNVFSVDWDFRIEDQTVVFGKDVKEHSTFIEILAKIKKYFTNETKPQIFRLAPEPCYLKESAFHNIDEERLKSIPKNKTALKLHPLYTSIGICSPKAIIYPQRPLIGQIGNDLIYLKANVHKLRTSNGWYRNGMIVKNDAKPCKKLGKLRLYAEFQTYPINIQGITMKRMDAFHPNMTPAGCAYICDTSGMCARLGIKHAESVVGFRMNKPVIRGCFVENQHIFVINESLREEEYYSRVIECNKLYENTLKDWHILIRQIKQYQRIKKELEDKA